MGALGESWKWTARQLLLTKLASYELELNYHWISQSEGELQYLAQRV